MAAIIAYKTVLNLLNDMMRNKVYIFILFLISFLMNFLKFPHVP